MTNAERCRAYYLRNRERRLAKAAEYYAEHRDERLAYAAQYQREHREEHREATERHRTKDPQATREYHRAYYRRTVDHQRPRKAAEQRAAKRRTERDVVKKDARRAVARALRDGRLAKPAACAKCGEEAVPHRLHAHHTDYAQPLVVTWLCSLCHGEAHQIGDN